MSTGQLRLFASSKADYAAKASLLKALDPTSAVTVEKLKFWDRWWYEPGRYLVELDIPSACSHHRQVHKAVVQYGRDLCRT